MARFCKSFKSTSGGEDFRSLIGALSNVFGDGSLVALVIEDSGGSGARLDLTVSEAGSVDGYCDEFFHGGSGRVRVGGFVAVLPARPRASISDQNRSFLTELPGPRSVSVFFGVCE